MKRHCWVAAMAATWIAPQALAQEAIPADHQPPLAIAAQDTLGRAGLMRSYFESDQFGSVQWRIGQARTTIGSAANAPLAKSKYKDGTTDTVVPLNFMHVLPDGESAIHLGVRGTFNNGANYPIESNGGTGRLDLQYLWFPDTRTMFGIGGVFERTHLNNEGLGTYNKTAGGIRADVLNEFAEHWGIAARAEYSWGKGDLTTIIGPNMTLRHNQGDDHLYTQAELVGQYRHADIAAIPEGWVLHPSLGLQFQRDFLEATADSFGTVSSGVVGATENYGTGWAYLRMEKEAAPNHLSPNVLVGFEREYVNSLDSVVNEPNYAVFGGGISLMTSKGNRFEVSYTRHQGLQGNRWNEAIVGTVTVNF
jgi:hypothetical protein